MLTNPSEDIGQQMIKNIHVTVGILAARCAADHGGVTREFVFHDHDYWIDRHVTLP